MTDLLAHLPEIQRAARAVWHSCPAVRLVLGERQDAEQQAVVYCLHYGVRYHDGTAPLSTYYRVLARRGVWQALHRWRQRRRCGAPLVMAVEVLPERGGCDVTAAVLDRLEVAQALGVLTPREREAVALRYGLDGSGVERDARAVAALMGVTYATAKTTLRSAYARLRRNFAVNCQED